MMTNITSQVFEGRRETALDGIGGREVEAAKHHLALAKEVGGIRL